MKRRSGISGQILQIFSKREFFETAYDTKAVKKEDPRGENGLNVFCFFDGENARLFL
jgi:hypothetical protein